MFSVSFRASYLSFSALTGAGRVSEIAFRVLFGVSLDTSSVNYAQKTLLSSNPYESVVSSIREKHLIVLHITSRIQCNHSWILLAFVLTKHKVVDVLISENAINTALTTVKHLKKLEKLSSCSDTIAEIMILKHINYYL